MKIIQPSFAVIEQETGIDGIYKAIEIAGRTCYKSEDKMTADSAYEFVKRMAKSGHGAMLEHGTVYLKCADSAGCLNSMPLRKYLDEPYSRVRYVVSPTSGKAVLRVTTNLRVIMERGWLDDLRYWCEPDAEHERRVMVRFVCDRGVSHEFVRHRVFSFAQESTRYCNYSKDKFGNELTFIAPCWLDWKRLQSYERKSAANYPKAPEGMFVSYLKNCERHYLYLLRVGWAPQEARAILPNALKTELVMTGFLSDWERFFKLRCAPTAHPQARELANALKDEFVFRGWIGG